MHFTHLYVKYERTKNSEERKIENIINLALVDDLNVQYYNFKYFSLFMFLFFAYQNLNENKKATKPLNDTNDTFESCHYN